MSKLKPILFSTPMVQALLEGRKTKTRRLSGLEEINDAILETDYFFDSFGYLTDIKTLNRRFAAKFKSSSDTVKFAHPSYEVGDIMWVYEFDGDGFHVFNRHDSEKLIGWKPSIFMPFDLCRLFLEVTEVRVEKIRDITESDAISEGIERHINEEGRFRYRDYISKSDPTCGMPIYSFLTLWDSINGPESWERNDYVWVYTFKKVEKPQ